MTKKERAMALFTQGYNCAQSVVLAFADELDADEAALARLSSSAMMPLAINWIYASLQSAQSLSLTIRYQPKPDLVANRFSW